MAVIPLYRDLLHLGPATCWERYPAYFAGLRDTYGDEAWGPDGVAGALARLGPAALAQIRRVAASGWEEAASGLLGLAYRQLPGPAADCYLGTLLFLAPAATLAVAGAPVLAVGLERFDPAAQPWAPPPRTAFHFWELPEMLPHEAAHVARMRALGLPATPRALALKEMILLEGTALHFADSLLGRETLRTFMPAAEIARHQALDPLMRAAAVPDLALSGLPLFYRYFGPEAAISGYYLGLSICREYAARTGAPPVALVVMPTDLILQTVGITA